AAAGGPRWRGGPGQALRRRGGAMDCCDARGIADEADCGIVAFAAAGLRPLGGTIKASPEDFRVRELPQQPAAVAYPGQQGSFLKFTLHKRGVDTLEALDSLAQACRVPARSFGFAGIKDSLAITTQEVTVSPELVSEAALLEAAGTLPQLRALGLRPCDAPLSPGMLAGNRFLLRVRGVRASARRVRQALRSLRRRGFVNYVGMQRFGKAGVRSDLLGLAYLRGEYERCVDLLLHQGAGGCRNEAGAGGREFKWVETFRRTGSAAATFHEK
ncbi:unnamed protein product, partial [Prorocentrum cordatum]